MQNYHICSSFVTPWSFDDQNGNLKWIFDEFIFCYEEHITEMLVLSNLNWFMYLVDRRSQSVIKPDCYLYYTDKYCKSAHLESLCINIGSASVSNVNTACYSKLPPTKYRIGQWHIIPIFEFQTLHSWYRQWYADL